MGYTSHRVLHEGFCNDGTRDMIMDSGGKDSGHKGGKLLDWTLESERDIRGYYLDTSHLFHIQTWHGALESAWGIRARLQRKLFVIRMHLVGMEGGMGWYGMVRMGGW